MGNKYKSKRTFVNDHSFQSKKEANRYSELKLLEAAHLISDLQTQVKFELIPAQYAPDTIGRRGKKIKGKLLERNCVYIADFVYTDRKTGEKVVEDTKGFRTKDYVIKRKLMLFVHHIKIKEV